MTSTTTTAEVNMASAALRTRYTPQEYLALERDAEYRSEYVDGFIVSKPGGSREHSLIVTNLCAELGNRLVRRVCETYVVNMRVLVSQTGLFTYPDIIVVCGEPLFLDEERDTLLNPTFIAEVAPPMTEPYDRGDQLMHYSRLPSLREYILVAQDEVLVARFLREGDDWHSTSFRNLDDTLQLTSIDCNVPLREVYAKIVLPQAPSAETQQPRT
jgi:Uma2 family endonuclease